MEGAANKAVENVMMTLQSQLEAQQRFLIDVNNAVTTLTSDVQVQV